MHDGDRTVDVEPMELSEDPNIAASKLQRVRISDHNHMARFINNFVDRNLQASDDKERKDARYQFTYEYATRTAQVTEGLRLQYTRHLHVQLITTTQRVVLRANEKS